MDNKSFTLIEILIVIIVVGILSTFVLVISNNITESSRDAQRKHDVDNLQKLILSYKTLYGLAPIEATECDIRNDASGCTILKAALIPDHAQLFPTDPSGTYYTYQSADGTDFTIKASLSNDYFYEYKYSNGFSEYTNLAHQDFGGTCVVSHACSPGSCWGVVNGTDICYQPRDALTTLTRTWTELKYITRIEWRAGGTETPRTWYLDVYDGSNWQQVDTVTTGTSELRNVNIGYNISAVRIRRAVSTNWHTYYELYAY